MKDIVIKVIGENPSILNTLIELIVIVLGVLASKLVIKLKEKYSYSLDMDKLQEIIDIIKESVVYVNQTYVDNIKKMYNNKLDDEFAAYAKNLAVSQIKLMLTPEQVSFIKDKYTSLDAFIDHYIENFVNSNKSHSQSANNSLTISNLEPANLEPSVTLFDFKPDTNTDSIKLSTNVEETTDKKETTKSKSKTKRSTTKKKDTADSSDKSK